MPPLHGLAADGWCLVLPPLPVSRELTASLCVSRTISVQGLQLKSSLKFFSLTTTIPVHNLVVQWLVLADRDEGSEKGPDSIWGHHLQKILILLGLRTLCVHQRKVILYLVGNIFPISCERWLDILWFTWNGSLNYSLTWRKVLKNIKLINYNCIHLTNIIYH